MIEVTNLVYEYPSKRALDGINLIVRPRTITALVGPNGAGKTTLMRCLAALDAPYDGQVTIDGMNTREAPRAIHACLGYLSDFFGLYDALSVRRCLIFAARDHGLSKDGAGAAALKAAERVGLSDRLETPAAELSRALRQRLAIGQAIVHEPSVLLLDEPASGLDPEARRDLSHLLVAPQIAGGFGAAGETGLFYPVPHIGGMIVAWLEAALVGFAAYTVAKRESVDRLQPQPLRK